MKISGFEKIPRFLSRAGMIGIHSANPEIKIGIKKIPKIWTTKPKKVSSRTQIAFPEMCQATFCTKKKFKPNKSTKQFSKLIGLNAPLWVLCSRPRLSLVRRKPSAKCFVPLAMPFGNFRS